MEKHIRELQDVSGETDRMVVDAIEDAEEGAPLLRSFSPEPTARP